ncbi:hypothetical protein Taro_022730 [Colocasia esculenta]|uniref:Uncharacterized protein n=1 Tax=Colocasia esculenta TaxID=4460 RepID=A0A843V986_COLES|nr:hypothetical protein [Colocasia esculenta]
MSGVGPQLVRAVVVCVCVFFAVAHSPHSTGEVVGRSQRLASWRCGRCILLLVASGGGLVVLVVTAVHVVSKCASLPQPARHPTAVFYNPFLGAVRGGTGVCSSLTLWRVRDSGWFCLWDLNLEECVPRCCFCIVFDSAGFAGVVFGPTLVVGRGVTLFFCFVVLCSRLWNV